MDEESAADSYFDTRLGFDKKRNILWSTLWTTYFSKLFSEADSILELGAGWCDFINVAKVNRRVAVDIWPGVTEHAAQGVEAIVGSALELDFISDSSIDAVFASNLVEHLHREDFKSLLEEAARILSSRGKLVLLQPNYRLCSDRYFDDFTHISIWSDVSLHDYLCSLGWNVTKVSPKFLPLTVKSRFPVFPLAIKAYLKSPFKPFAGQMLVVAEPPRG